MPNMPIISALARQRQQNQELKVILGYSMSLRKNWAICPPVSKKKKEKTKFKTKEKLFQLLKVTVIC